jgi:hypothetical protein
MFSLTAGELDSAYAAIVHHGYSAMLPDPPEWSIIAGNWPIIREMLEKIDLDTYEPYTPMRVFAPKTRANVRVIHLLHPQDLIIYTALVLIAKDDIESHRVPIKSRRVFSYRVDVKNARILYGARGSYEAYRNQLAAKAKKPSIKFVAIADIADFYPRVYQHRLENVIESAATSQRVRDVARVLVRKFIGNLMGRNSYGIPVGPYASRLLGEGILIDVDASLQSQNVDFVRWVDDYNVFCKTEYEAQSVLFRLGEWLFTNHGLTLQTAKTRILPVDRYESEVLFRHEEKLTDRDTAVSILRDFRSEYEPSAEDTVDEDRENGNLNESDIEEILAQLQGIDLKGMLEASLADTTLVDYEAVIYALTKLPRIPGAPAKLKQDVLDLVIDNAELLYPVAEQIAKFVLMFDTLTPAEQRRIGTKLLKPLKSKQSPPPPFYAMWILHVFASANHWDHTRDIVSLYTGSGSEVVKRYAALAISTSGDRAQALAIKDDYVAASPLLKLAILFASRKLGNDERKHWRLANSVSGGIEKLI